MKQDNETEEVRWVLTNQQGKAVSPLSYLDEAIEDLDYLREELISAMKVLDDLGKALAPAFTNPETQPERVTSWCIKGKDGYFHGTTVDGVNCKTVSTKGAPLTWKKKHIAAKWINEARVIDPTCTIAPRTYTDHYARQ